MNAPLPDDAGLRAAWDRIKPVYAALSFEQAMAWEPLAIVIRMYARSLDRMSTEAAHHPTVRAMAHTYAARPPAPAREKKKPKRRKPKRERRPPPTVPDAKQRAANDVDMFEETAAG